MIFHRKRGRGGERGKIEEVSKFERPCTLLKLKGENRLT